MKPNFYYAGFLAAALLVLSGPASFATPTDPALSTDTTDQTETPAEGIVTVVIGEGSNATIQHYTYAPQSVEINAGDSVTWFASGELVDIHTVTFMQDPSVFIEILLPFAVPSDQTDFELLPPFTLGEPILIPAPDGREAIVALNKLAWYPAVFDANNQTTFLEGADIQATLNSTVKALNSGIILPPMPPMGEAQPNSTETGTAGEQQTPSETSVLNETTTMTNSTNGTTTDATTVPDDQAMSQATEGGAGEQPIGPPFPVVSSFTVTFEEPGAYSYICAIHPWMNGEVVVGGEAQTETQGQNQTETQGQNQTETQGQNELEPVNPIFQ
jgi:plastocyanin